MVIAPKVKPGGAKPKGSGSGAAGDSPASQPGTPKEGGSFPTPELRIYALYQPRHDNAP